MIVGNVGNLNMGKLNIGMVGGFGGVIIGIAGLPSGTGGFGCIGGIGEDFWLVAPVPPILTWWFPLAITTWFGPVEVLVITFCCRVGIPVVTPKTFLAVVDGIVGTMTGLKPVLTNGVTMLSPGIAVIIGSPLIGILDSSSTGTAPPPGIIIIIGWLTG